MTIVGEWERNVRDGGVERARKREREREKNEKRAKKKRWWSSERKKVECESSSLSSSFFPLFPFVLSCVKFDLTIVYDLTIIEIEERERDGFSLAWGAIERRRERKRGRQGEREKKGEGVTLSFSFLASSSPDR